MNINITSKQIIITPAIRQHIDERIQRLRKWHIDLINPHVTLNKAPQGFSADATITTPNGTFAASATHADMYTAINEMVAKLETQLNKAQHKSESRRNEPRYRPESSL